MTISPVYFRTSKIELTISSLSTARAALELGWPNKADPAYREAVRLLNEARDGTCSPRAAFAAFIKAARTQNLIVDRPPSRFDRWLDIAAL